MVARAAGGGREPVLRRPGARLPGRPRGCAEVQGDQLPPRRGLPDLRAQARPARADLARGARPSRSSPTTSSPSATSPRCTRSPPAAARWSSSPTTGSTSATCGCRADRRTPHRARARPDPADHPAAGARLPRGAPAGPRHRQAPQPGEVGHRRVAGGSSSRQGEVREEAVAICVFWPLHADVAATGRERAREDGSVAGGDGHGVVVEPLEENEVLAGVGSGSPGGDGAGPRAPWRCRRHGSPRRFAAPTAEPAASRSR